MTNASPFVGQTAVSYIRTAPLYTVVFLPVIYYGTLVGKNSNESRGLTRTANKPISNQ